MDEQSISESALENVFRLQNGLIARATGYTFDGGDIVYKELRGYFIARSDTEARLPDFLRRCRDLAQFWSFIKYEYAQYRERRDFIWNAFQPLIDYLQSSEHAPGTEAITETLSSFDTDYVHTAWQKALNRRKDDPEGAITAARTLLETVCKHILDDMGVTCSDDVDLPKLWSLAAEQMNLAPSQHQESIFRSILGNCQSVVNNLGAIRNRVGDAHGQGRRSVRPKPRHAELAVNLAGSMASFLVATWNELRASRNS